MLLELPPRRPRIPWLTALVSICSLGIAFAQPPDRTPSSDEPTVQGKDEVWQIAADELGVHIRQLEQHLAWMRKWAAFRKDSDTVAAVEALQQKLNIAKDNHRELCRPCDERLHDTPDAIACCQKIDDVMYEVIEEHVALMQRLNAHRKRRGK